MFKKTLNNNFVLVAVFVVLLHVLGIQLFADLYNYLSFSFIIFLIQLSANLMRPHEVPSADAGHE